MGHTLSIPDDLYARLEDAARRRSMSIEDLLRVWQANDWSDRDTSAELHRRRTVVARIEALRAELAGRYGEMPDSTALVREDRAR